VAISTIKQTSNKLVLTNLATTLQTLVGYWSVDNITLGLPCTS